jgi:hypothetical protein
MSGDMKSWLGLVESYTSIYGLSCMERFAWRQVAPIGCKYSSAAEINTS